MPYGIPKTEEERRKTHIKKYGTEPPKERMGMGNIKKFTELIKEVSSKFKSGDIEAIDLGDIELIKIGRDILVSIPKGKDIFMIHKSIGLAPVKVEKLEGIV